MRYYDRLVFELSKKGRKGYSLNAQQIPGSADSIPSGLLRAEAPALPEVSEIDVVRHYTNLSQMNFGVDTGFYPLGSCTMKYNPKINEEMASLAGFQGVHPLQDASTVEGVQEVYDLMDRYLATITGMKHFTFKPCAGAHGELTGLMIMRSYHMSRKDYARTKVIVPDSAHGTNPASAAVCGLEIVVVKSNAAGLVDVEDLKPLLGPDIAGIMMTNPNTCGLFEKDIKEIAKLVHGCGGLLYYDGANMNPLLGAVRPGEMGFDIMHLNLHKTFSSWRRRSRQRPCGSVREARAVPRSQCFRLPWQLRRHRACARVRADARQAEPQDGRTPRDPQCQLYKGVPSRRLQASYRLCLQA